MQERNYLSVSFFILIVFLLLIGGNFLIKNKHNMIKEKITTKIKKDSAKDYIYYTDDGTYSYALDLSYPSIHININSEEAKSLENTLNTKMTQARASIVKLSDVSINKNDIVYEIGSEDIYEADFLKYNTYESDNYLTLEVSFGHLNITKEDEPTYLEYYTFAKESGKILTDEEIMKIGSLTEKEIFQAKKKYEEDNQVTVEAYHLYLDKYTNVHLNLLVNAGNITYNDTVKI